MNNSSGIGKISTDITVQVDDQDNGFQNVAGPTMFEITAVNDAPTLSATGSDPGFTEGDSAASLFSGSAVTGGPGGESDQGIENLTLTVSNVVDGGDEVLNLDGSTIALSGGNTGTTSRNGIGYSVSLSGGTATLDLDLTPGSFNGLAPSTLKGVIDAMRYEHTGEDPSAGSDRTVTITEIQDDGGTPNGGSDTIIASGGGTFDFAALTNDVGGGFDMLQTTGSGPFTVVVDATSGLDDFTTYTGQSGETETLEVSGGSVDLTQESFSDWDVITATTMNATLDIDAGVLASVQGFTATGGGTETLRGNLGPTADLSGRKLSGFEVIENTAIGDTTFKLDGSASFGDVSQFKTGDAAGTDTLETADTALDVSGVTLTNVDTVATSNATGTTFTLDSGQTGLKVDGGGGTDRVTVNGGTPDATSLALQAIEILDFADGATATVDQALVDSVGDISGGSGTERLATGANSLDLTGVNLANVEELEGTGGATTFTVTSGQLGTLGTFVGGAAGSTLEVTGTTLNASCLTLPNVDTFTTSNMTGTNFTGTGNADTITGNSGDDTIAGGAGEDTISGGAGADTLMGAAGDRLVGDFGGDTFDLTGLDGDVEIVDATPADRFVFGRSDLDLDDVAMTTRVADGTTSTLLRPDLDGDGADAADPRVVLAGVSAASLAVRDGPEGGTALGLAGPSGQTVFLSGDAGVSLGEGEHVSGVGSVPGTDDGTGMG